MERADRFGILPRETLCRFDMATSPDLLGATSVTTLCVLCRNDYHLRSRINNISRWS